MGNSATLTTTVVPSFALFVTTCMWMSPLKVVLASRKSRDLGDTSPVPYVCTVFNCIGWTGYGIMKKDMFLFWSNVTGIVLGSFFAINALTILASQTKPFEQLSEKYRTLEAFLIFAFGFWPLMFLVSVFAFQKFSDPAAQSLQFIGTIGMICSIAYYAAPLATMMEVVKLKDSSSLYAPMICLNMLNALLWASYGAALQDINVFAPNFIGLVLAVVQLVMWALYRKKDAAKTAMLSVEEGGDI